MRQLFSSRTATVLTMVGVAVGLGNVWRFPYMMGQYGGSAFLLVYLGFAVVFAVPALTCEWALGRESRAGPVGAFRHAFGPVGRWIGWLLVGGVTIANSYYIVVVANVTYTTIFSATTGFAGDGVSRFQEGLNDGSLQWATAIGVVCLAAFVIDFGLQRGIEGASKVFVPFFGVVVLYLIFHSLSLPGALPALADFLRPDFGAMTATNVFAAMGQAFFSLSLGGTFYVIYGSYLRDDEPIPSTAVLTASGDVGAAVLAALFIVPTTLALGLDLETGPRLIFVTLPELFNRIPAGRLLGSLFLLALGFVAFLSAIAAFQVPVGTLEDAGVKRRHAVLGIGLVEIALMTPTAFNPGLIQPLDLIFGSGMQVLGSGITVVALVWGLGRARTVVQIFGGTESRWIGGYFHWTRWGVPLGLLVTLGLYLAAAF